jgi:hypothetical protein
MPSSCSVTQGIKDTVERALDEIVAADLRRRAFDMEGLELDNPDVMAKAWH